MEATSTVKQSNIDLQKASRLLKEVFGFPSFRPSQALVIEKLLSNQDVLALMPTGGGKSLCYQIPALCRPGCCLVVSPLIALMKDQVDALRQNGVAAAFINSNLDAKEENKLINDAIAGRLKLLYLSPERLLNSLDKWVKRLRLNFIAIDEAHCISAWGHDFRPVYTELAKLRDLFPKVPCIALTATADQLTRQDIVEQMGMKSPYVFVDSFDRPNLNLNVVSGLGEAQKMRAIADFVFEHMDESGIIYCLSRKSSEKIAQFLINKGIPAAWYHAGMDPDDRSRVQQGFVFDQIQIVCATVAFGMGIDKPNVRWVIHYNLPKNIESYYQEIGRAGRDGLPGETLLFYNVRDVVILSKQIKGSKQAYLNSMKLQRMQNFADSPSCRRKALLAYFGEYMEDNCENCDVCRNPPQSFDGTILIQKALSSLKRMGKGVSFSVLILSLRGVKSQKISANRWDMLPTFGVGKDLDADLWQYYLLQMLNLGVVEVDYKNGASLMITSFGNDILYGRKKQELVRPMRKLKSSSPKSTKAPDANKALLVALKRFRMSKSKVYKCPAYSIFNDQSLQELIQKKPLSQRELLDVHGFGVFKVERFGNELVQLIAGFMSPNQLKVNVENELKLTLQFVQQGYSLEGIARLRGLTVGKLGSQIAELYRSKQINSIQKFIPKEELEQIIIKLKPLKLTYDQATKAFELLNAEVKLYKIKLALAEMEVKS